MITHCFTLNHPDPLPAGIMLVHIIVQKSIFPLLRASTRRPSREKIDAICRKCKTMSTMIQWTISLGPIQKKIDHIRPHCLCLADNCYNLYSIADMINAWLHYKKLYYWLFQKVKCNLTGCLQLTGSFQYHSYMCFINTQSAPTFCWILMAILDDVTVL